MHFTSALVALAAAGFSAVHAHMLMNIPIPYGKSSLNNSPLNGDGSDYPCKQRGGVYNAEGANTVMPVGSTQQLAFKGSAVHGGGSCQISVTYDKNPTKDSVFKVIHSIIGGCPAKNVDGNLPSDPNGGGAGTYSFQIPKDLPPGEVTLAWTWFNKVGNREMYMNCAPVTITGSGGSKSAFNSLPDMFKANIGNGCSTVPNKDVDFPNPGQAISKFGGSPPVPPTGTCPAGNGSGSSSSGEPSSNNGATSPASAPTTTATTTAKTYAAGPSETALPFNPGGQFITQSASATPTSYSASKSTTLATSTSSAATTKPTGHHSGSSGSGSTTGGQTGACSPEGAFVCLPGGKAFQQCGSGRWTPIMPMAQGTSCAPPQAADNSSGSGHGKQYKRHAKRHLRFGNMHLRRHHGLSLASA
jgi:hypothetical protein